MGARIILLVLLAAPFAIPQNASEIVTFQSGNLALKGVLYKPEGVGPSAAMKKAGKSYAVKIYPPYGRSHQDGHTFGYFGAKVWEHDVFEFLGRYCTTGTAEGL